jgi:hypothetical protein
LKRQFGLTLFGFDVLVSPKSHGEATGTTAQQVIIVDVNYFPSYKEVTDFPRRLRQYLKKLASRET